MKNNKKAVPILNIFTSIVSLILAIRYFVNGETSNGVLWGIIAFTWLCVFVINLKKDVSK